MVGGLNESGTTTSKREVKRRRSTERKEVQCSLRTLDGIKQTATIDVATLLRSCLSDDRIDVIEEASTLLKRIFQTESCRKSFESGESEEIRDFFLPFIHVEEKSEWQRPAEPTTNVDPFSLFTCEDPVTGLKKSYPDWVKELAAALCATDQSNEMWPLCAHMCTLRQDFAELVFPYLIVGRFIGEARSQETNNDKVEEALGMAVQKFLESQNMEVKAIRLVLGALEQLRIIYQKVMRDPEATKCLLSKKVMEWRKPFWLDIRCADVARAALKCDLHITALLYMELADHVDKEDQPHRFSVGGVLGSMSDNDRLRLRAYRQIDEPDGMAAFNRLCDGPSLLVSWEQEGLWERALGMFDSILASSNETDGGARSSGGELLERTEAQGLVNSLSMLGCSHLARTAATVLLHEARDQVCFPSLSASTPVWRDGCTNHHRATRGLNCDPLT